VLSSQSKANRTADAMKLAKPQVDIGLSTNDPDPLRDAAPSGHRELIIAIELSQRASIVGALAERSSPCQPLCNALL
jgi:hypothetical protein